jgi:hypothetical protein
MWLTVGERKEREDLHLMPHDCDEKRTNKQTIITYVETKTNLPPILICFDLLNSSL